MMPDALSRSAAILGGSDPDEAPAAMRNRPSAVGDLVLLVLDTRVDGRVAFERPVLDDRCRVAGDPESDDRLLPSRDERGRGEFRGLDVGIEGRGSVAVSVLHHAEGVSRNQKEL